MREKTLQFALLWVFVLILLFAKNSFAELVYPFSGEFDFANKSLQAQVDLKDNGALDFDFSRNSKGKHILFLTADHLRTPFFDLSSEIKSSMTFDPRTHEIRGTINSQYSLVDYKPITELSGSFKISKNKILIPSLKFGNVGVEGYCNLYEPYKMNFNVKMASMGMDDFLNFWVINKGYDSSGEVFGTIKASGTIKKPFLEGSLKGQDGFIKSLRYNEIHLHIEGFYPQMNIADSILSRADGTSVIFSGPFDLSDRKNFRKQMKELTLAPIVRNSDEKIEWTIKRLRDSEDGSTTELKYLLRQDTKEGFSDSGGSAMFGVEKAFEF